MKLQTFRYLTDAPFESMKPDNIRRVKNRYRRMMEEAYKPYLERATEEEKQTIKHRIDDRLNAWLYCLQSYYNFLIARGYMGDKTKKDYLHRYTDNPLVHLKKPRLSRKSPRKPFTKEDMTALRYVAKHRKDGELRKFWLRNILTVDLGYHLRLRTGEFIRAEFSWFEKTFETLEVHVPAEVLKIPPENIYSVRTVPASILPLLADYIDLCAKDPESAGAKPPLLFNMGIRALQESMSRWGRLAGIEGCCFHRFGNTLASDMDEQGFSGNDIAFKGGWSAKAEVYKRYITRPPESLVRRAKEFDIIRESKKVVV